MSQPNLSRRTVVSMLAVAPINTKASTSSTDAELMALGEENAGSSFKLARCRDLDEAKTVLDRIYELRLEIAAAEANSLCGLVVKARAITCAFDLNFCPMELCSYETRIVASIVRDLLRLAPNDIV